MAGSSESLPLVDNSDASAYAYVNGAIDAADRAVDEQLSL